MAEMFVQISVSLDGYIEDRDGGLDWFVDDTSLDELATETLRSIDGMIFGRKAHALLAKFWMTAGETKGASAELVTQAALMNTLPKFVLTHGEETTGWTNSHAIRLDDMPRMKREAKRPIAVFAGASAAQAALERGVIDEIRLIQYPLILGDGTPLFGRGAQRRDLDLTDSRRYGSGAIVRHYRFKRR
jgi:dihydrofolate reductase